MQEANTEKLSKVRDETKLYQERLSQIQPRAIPEDSLQSKVDSQLNFELTEAHIKYEQ